MLSRAVASAALIAALAATAAARGGDSVGVVSPTVVATGIGSPYGGGELVLLVLWRGSPGWMMKGNHGVHSDSEGSGRFGEGHSSQHFSYGGHAFTIETDTTASKHTATILGREIALDKTNVVLVDHVDSADGPKIVAELHIDPPPEAANILQSIQYVLAHHPDLLAYVGCDKTVPDPLQQALFTLLCGQLTTR